MKRLLPVLAIGSLLLGCGDSQAPGEGGDLFVSYHAGTPDAGAMVLLISGGKVESVSPVGDQRVSFTSLYPTTTRVVVIGDVTSGDLLRIRVPDVSQVTSYTVRADQVADKATFALIDPARHTFSVHR
jgi:hypothetical protein